MRANTGAMSRTNQFIYSIFSKGRTDVLIESEVIIPQRIDLQDNWNSYSNFMQFKGTNLSGDRRNDPLWIVGINTRGGKGSGGANYFQLAYLGQFWKELGLPQFSAKALKEVDIPFNKKVKIGLRYALANDGTGIIQFYQDGELVFYELGITFPSDLVSNMFFSINNYGEGMIAKDESGNTLSQGFVDILVNTFKISEVK